MSPSVDFTPLAYKVVRKAFNGKAVLLGPNLKPAEKVSQDGTWKVSYSGESGQLEKIVRTALESSINQSFRSPFSHLAVSPPQARLIKQSFSPIIDIDESHLVYNPRGHAVDVISKNLAKINPTRDKIALGLINDKLQWLNAETLTSYLFNYQDKVKTLAEKRKNQMVAMLPFRVDKKLAEISILRNRYIRGLSESLFLGGIGLGLFEVGVSPIFLAYSYTAFLIGKPAHFVMRGFQADYWQNLYERIPQIIEEEINTVPEEKQN